MAYIDILLILLRKLCLYFPNFNIMVHHYLPHLACIIKLMQQSSKLVKAWCILEAVFYIALKIHIAMKRSHCLCVGVVFDQDIHNI
jgi:hypothetical protein